MSDFDKEAEREKLREKYERDKQDRESTERMSDLLLKGATMTNTHCGTCGDPIFRHEGQEFCPTCQEVVTEGEAATQTDDGAAPADAQAADGAAATGSANPSDGPAGAQTADAPADSGTPDSAPADSARAPDAGVDGSNDPADWTTSMDPSVADAVETEGQSARGSQERGTEAAGAAPAVGGADGDLASARESLARTITRLTKRADASDDLERTRAYLAAVEEAADALAAVKRADR